MLIKAEDRVYMASGKRSSSANSTGKSNTGGSGSGRSGNGRSSTSKGSSAKSGSAKSGTGRNSRSRKDLEAEYARRQTIRREIILWLIMLVALLLFISNFGVGGVVGNAASSVLFGIFGIFAYVVPILLIVGAVFVSVNRMHSRALVYFITSVVILLFLCMFVSLVVHGQNMPGPVKEYQYSVQYKFGGGFLGGCLASLFTRAFGLIGAYIVDIIVLIVCVVIITGKSIMNGIAHGSRKVYDSAKDSYEEHAEERRQMKQMRMDRKVRGVADTTIPVDGDAEDAAGQNTQNGTNPPDTAAQQDKPESWASFMKRKHHAQGKDTQTTSAQQDTGQQKPLSAWEQNTTVPREDPTSAEFYELHPTPSGLSDEMEQKLQRMEAVGNTGAADDGNPVWNPDGKGSNATTGAGYPSGIAGNDAYDSSNWSNGIQELFSDYAPLDDDTQVPFPEDDFKRRLEQSIAAQDPDVSGKSSVQLRPKQDDMSATHNDFQENGRANGAAGIPEDATTYVDPLTWQEDPSVTHRHVAVSADAAASDLTAEELMAAELGAAAADIMEDHLSDAGGTQGRGTGNRTHRASARKSDTVQSQAAGGAAKQDTGFTAGNGAAATAGTGAAAAGTGAQIVKTRPKKYVFPSTRLLQKPQGRSSGSNAKELRETAQKLQSTLDTFGVKVTVTDVSCGPAVTRYELQPEMGVKVSKIVNLADDIKLNLAAADIRIEAPIPGKAAVGIEVPNTEAATVSFRELVESDEFQNAKSKISFVLGRDIAGQIIVADIAKMPHLLIAGATGSGKSVCINTIIMSILYKASPDEVRLMMIDPKVVELSVYNGIPHLLIPVVTDPKKAASALNWAVSEMTERYKRFAEAGVRKIDEYNAKIEKMRVPAGEEAPKRMTQIVIIVDELADLMMVASRDVEESICRLAQLARAAGIHLIIATQRPSVNVITGLIKANMPSRIAFAVSSGIDSRTILDMNGAEKLLGRGDMLYYPQGAAKPMRVQGAFVPDEDVSAVADFLREQNDGAAYSGDVEQQMEQLETAGDQPVAINDIEPDDGRDAYFAEAARVIVDKEKASIGMLQRYLKVGFNRAARIMDQLEEAGVVGPEMGTKPRTVQMTPEELEVYLQESDS